MKSITILSTFLLLAMSSCSSEDIFYQEQTNNYEKRISVVAEDLTPADGTRTSYTESANGNGYHFAWTAGDALGIFPENGYQTAFPINEGKGVGTNTAVFDGGDWALKANKSYAAYYPFIESLSFGKTAIPVDYTGQVQNSNGSTTHLSAYDYMASTFTEVDAKGNVSFQLQHLGCLVQFKLTMPETDTYSALEITSDKTPFITSGKYSLSDNDHTFKNPQTSQTITIGLNNVSTTAEERVLTIAAMFAPIDLSDSKLSLTVKGDKKDYSFFLDGQNLAQGKAASNECDIPYVTFHADATQTLKMSKAVANLEYSRNGVHWSELGTSEITFGGSDGNLRIRGKSSTGTATSINDYSTIIFGNSTAVSCSGDIRTLIDYDNYATTNTADARFCFLFKNCTCLTSTPDLPATNLASYCYSGMFRNCSSIVSAPNLPAISLSMCCYDAMFYECTSLTDAPLISASTMAISSCINMFNNCTSLTVAPDLSATVLAQDCYKSMFKDCSSLTNAPTLSATSLKYGCYESMFYGCTSLVNAPSLPATNVYSNCYKQMFQNCTSLNTAPTLPATTIGENCYDHMFYGCTNLTSIPTSLPATSLAVSCYRSMFENCVSLTRTPALPATTLAYDCYNNMFSGCTKLTSVPSKLPATTLALECYRGMFSNCTGLNTTPALPATALSDYCYYNMFSGCTNLTTSPALPASELTTGCYESMFNGCTKLTAGPTLPATTLSTRCYKSMFYGCTKLNSISVKFTTWMQSATENWLYGVSSTGTFSCPVSLSTTTQSSSRIPSDWTVVKDYGVPVVDLGLPSGTIWAAENVGPKDQYGRGGYYAWGETTTKSTYTISNYSHTPTATLSLSDDVARQTMGGKWRIPTKAQWDELISYCNWEKYGEFALKGTSKRNSKTIIIPLGCCQRDNSIPEQGDNCGVYYGAYWSIDYYMDSRAFCGYFQESYGTHYIGDDYEIYYDGSWSNGTQSWSAYEGLQVRAIWDE